MKSWTNWEIVRHHVSICGRVLDKDGNRLPGIRLSVSKDEKQPESQSEYRATRRRESGKVGKEANKILMQTKQAESRPDGTFFFLDCPDGQYTITALHVLSGMQDQKSISVMGNAMKKRTKDRSTDEGYQIELTLRK